MMCVYVCVYVHLHVHVHAHVYVSLTPYHRYHEWTAGVLYHMEERPSLNWNLSNVY